MINPLQMLMQNPIGMLKQAGYNIPNGMTNPNQILQYMLQNNPMLQQRYQQIMQMFGGRR
jgi:hypothetical protein